MPRVTRRPKPPAHAGHVHQTTVRQPEQSVASRGYALGERNPATLPNGRNGWETSHENERNTAARRQILAWVQSGRSVGAKYFH